MEIYYGSEVRSPSVQLPSGFRHPKVGNFTGPHWNKGITQEECQNLVE